MTKFTPSKLIPGILAVVIYLLVVGLLIFYFNTKNETKSKQYVKKDEHRIQVALAEPSKAKQKKVIKKKKKVSPKKSVVKKTKPKPKKSTQKKVIKEKIVKKKKVKKRDVNKTRPKKKNSAKDLFANVKTTPKKSLIKVTDKPIKSKPKSDLIKVLDKPKSASERVNASLKNQKNKRSGVENAYLAKVQHMLEGWPAQSDYAGEKVKVILHIRESGFFDFKIKSASRNPNFNAGLTAYLEQLQEFGFGAHKGGRTYHFEAEFIAKE